MHTCDALIVGGGPAGSTCARVLRLAGWNVIVMDRARFPRDKVCGGWITPEVFPLLDLDPGEYRATGRTLQPITGFRTSVLGGRPIETRYRSVISYAIRRCEFDEYLLRRADSLVLEGAPLTAIRRDRGAWIVNEAIQAGVVIGAGGHFCPVARYLQGRPDAVGPVVAKELEFRVRDDRTTVLSETPELFFSHDLEGYGWCVRKGDYLNVGIGRRGRSDFATHVRDFVDFLVTSGRAPDASAQAWTGHAYHAAGAGTRPLVGEGILVVGDAAGLAYPESGEGIRPAVESGRLAAQTLIAAGGGARFDDLLPYATRMRQVHRPPQHPPAVLRPTVKAIGRTLLRHSPAFARHIVLDRWFLRNRVSPSPGRLDGTAVSA